MDPTLIAQLMAQLQDTDALQPGFDPGTGGGDAPQGAPAQQGGQFGQLLQGIKAPPVTKPQFSGGISGAGLPYKTQVTDLLSGALAPLSQTPQLPSLGALIAQAPRR